MNLLIGSSGLRGLEDEARLAREFVPPTLPSLTVLLADPFDLLRNKLSVNRPKDPRRRLAPAERLLDVLGESVLSQALADRLLPLSRTGADLRFLAHRVPTRAQLDQVIARAVEPNLATSVGRIAASRRFSD